MKLVDTKEAVGHVICHDMTRIVKDTVKETVFRKGHQVKAEDIPVLLSMGKEHLYIWENVPDMIHENDAAEMLFTLFSNQGMLASPIKEGKIEFIAEYDGLFMIDTDLLEEINMEDEIIVSTRHHYFPVKKGDVLAGTRVIPLMVHLSKIQRIKEIAKEKKLFQVLPYTEMKAGIIATGSEIFHKRIEDTFTDVVIEKLKEFHIETVSREIVDDAKRDITKAILNLKSKGVQFIVCTGGMSVDPDDVTPSAILESGADIVSYGAPVLPGSMFLLGYFQDNTPIVGLPGCVMYNKATVFDILLPRISAGVSIDKRQIARLANGGLCLKCPTCSYPECSFGKGA